MLFVITYYRPHDNSTTAIIRNLRDEDEAKQLFNTHDNSSLMPKRLYKLEDDGSLNELSNKKECLTCGNIIDRDMDICNGYHCDGYYGFQNIN